MTERKLTIGFVVALLVQSASGLLWAGAAAERISVLEANAKEVRPVLERLARVETELEAVRAQLHRIEDKVDRL